MGDDPEKEAGEGHIGAGIAILEVKITRDVIVKLGKETKRADISYRVS